MVHTLFSKDPFMTISLNYSFIGMSALGALGHRFDPFAQIDFSRFSIILWGISGRSFVIPCCTLHGASPAMLKTNYSQDLLLDDD